MIKSYLLIIYVSLFCLQGVLAQNVNRNLSLIILDSISDTKLEDVSVTICNAKDTILVRYGWTKSNGEISIQGLPFGKFILFLNHPTYAQYVTYLEINNFTPLNKIETIKLSQATLLLKEVVIQGNGAGIIIKGDTIQYNSNSFVVEQNAKVEDLLKQIPGLQIDNYGKISAYGKKVDKILVDGEEFFGSDPTLVTRNIRGDMVRNIQIFDKRSDQASFTGIEDGIRTKTINVSLKEDKKKGYFGQINSGYGTQNFFQEQIMFNLFTDKTKFALFGNLANTGKVGLSGSENDKFGINYVSNKLIFRGIIGSLRNESDEAGTEIYNGKGYPIARNAGVHFDTKWNSNNKKTFNTNVSLGSITINNLQNTITINDLPLNSIRSLINQSSTNYSSKNKFDATYSNQFDTLTNLKISIDGGLNKSNMENNVSGTTIGKDLNQINSIESMDNNIGNQYYFNASELYNKKLHKARRTMSLLLSQTINESNNNDYLVVSNNFYANNGALSRKSVINQYRPMISRSKIFGGNFTYTEPITPNISLVASYGLGFTNSLYRRKAFNLSAAGIYDLLDLEFTNDFGFNEFDRRAILTFNYNKNRQTLALSNELSTIDFKQTDWSANKLFKLKYTTYIPTINYLNNQGSYILRFNYRGEAILPTIEQIQPIISNNDPLNILIGNTSLKPAYKHEVGFTYLLSKPLLKQSLNFEMSYALVSDPIVNDINTDFDGITTYRFSNLTNKKKIDFNLSSNYTKKIKDFDLNTSLSLNYNFNTSFSFSNSLVVQRNTQIYGGRLYFFKFKLKKYNFTVNLIPSYVNSKLLLGNYVDNSGYTFTSNVDMTVFLSKRTSIGSNTKYLYQSKTKIFEQNYNLFLLNVSLVKRFLSTENLRLTISINDLLNQNLGFNRYSYGALSTQNTYSTIKRYCMFSLKWDFSKFASQKTNQ